MLNQSVNIYHKEEVKDVLLVEGPEDLQALNGPDFILPPCKILLSDWLAAVC